MVSINQLPARLSNHLKDKGWTDMTSIQKAAYQHIFDGTSCIIEAPTSGGKTEAVLFPLLARFAGPTTPGVRILYIAPLKALLNDLFTRVKKYAECCSLDAFKWHGDVSQGDKVEQMLYPAQILLTTPESIEAILLRKANWQQVFANLETIVIDEAHYFAQTERGAHLMALLERIGEGIGKVPQRVAVTATIGNPEELVQWLTGNRPGGIPIKVPNSTSKQRDFLIEFIDEETSNLHSRLYQLLPNKKSIVFERSRSGTEDTATRINELNQLTQSRIPVKVKTHHSSVSKRLREDAEVSIKMASESSLNAIISTSTLELGIDIGDLDQVIQVGGLHSSGSFLQRVGRTGRRDGRPQFFRGFCIEAGELVLLAGCVSLGMAHQSEKILFPKRAFHILAHQIICICLQKKGATPDQIWPILSRAACFAEITRTEFDTLIAFMVKEDLLRYIHGMTLMTGDKAEKEFLRASGKRLFAIFDTGIMYDVVDGKKLVGTLDADFMRIQQLPFVFVLGGIEWNAKKIDHQAQQVLVSRNESGSAPQWTSMRSKDVPFELAQEIGRLLVAGKPLGFLDFRATVIMRREANQHSGLGWDNHTWTLDPSANDGKFYLWTFCGDKINRAIKFLLDAELGIRAKYDYQLVTIDIDKKKPTSSARIIDYLVSLGNSTEKELEQIIMPNMRASWFSKFSICLPDELAKITLREKGIDLAGLLREINKIQIRQLNDDLPAGSSGTFEAEAVE
ncbi:hypothetical protein D3H65_06315 [Paraflavitalea soli]|uniref:DEAD/DEAH box helicase n=1 Tax=Paraflavitalea soli TaxID=2315862 RepID=A0A3B7MHC4_9BACT|nr:DEAD/DEAH box helicase [Paraflavitalea soli]AXY73618.1 hypothetical protein D3H65_06315 [Paraflavitalea soli]